VYDYCVFGLDVRSELQCPELLPASFSVPDVDITFGAVPDTLDNSVFIRPHFELSKRSVLLRVPEVGRFLIEQGCRIRIQPETGVEQRTIRLFLLGSCLGAVLHQRGITPLHGSAISQAGCAVLICGQSGAGKSTTAAALASRGYSILTDDVSALTIQDQNVVLSPGYPQLKLWRNSMEHFQLPSRDYQQIRPTIAKHAVPVRADFESEPRPVLAMFWLNKQAISSPRLRELKGFARLRAVQANVYRKKYSNCRQRNFSQCAELSRRLAIFELTRPESDNTIEAVADIIEASLTTNFSQERFLPVLYRN
jgi:hypothetical protein